MSYPCRSQTGSPLAWAAMMAIACLACGCQEPVQSGPDSQSTAPRPFLGPGQLDDCAARFADALRCWPVVDRAATPVLLSSPRWRNESAVPVSGGRVLARELARAINLRTGAKVQIADPGAVGCDHATELVLRSGTDGQGLPVLVLAWRVVRPGDRTAVLEEICAVRRGASTNRQGPLLGADANGGAPTAGAGRLPARSYQDVAFEYGLLHLDASLARREVIVLGERTWRDADARLRVELRLLSRHSDRAITTLIYYVDEAGRRRSPVRAANQTLPAGRPTVLVVVLPKAARSYELFVVAR